PHQPPPQARVAAPVRQADRDQCQTVHVRAAGAGRMQQAHLAAERVPEQHHPPAVPPRFQVLQHRAHVVGQLRVPVPGGAGRARGAVTGPAQVHRCHREPGPQQPGEEGPVVAGRHSHRRPQHHHRRRRARGRVPAQPQVVAAPVDPLLLVRPRLSAARLPRSRHVHTIRTSLYRPVGRRPVAYPFMKPTEIAALRVPGRPTLSPDGRRVVVSVQQPDLAADEYAAQLWLAHTDGSVPVRRLTYGWRDSEPVWSPDGEWVAFTRAERDAATGAVGPPQLWLLPVGGGEPRRLTDHPLGVSEPVWSPDATRLAYLARVPEPGRYGSDGQVPAAAEPPRRITTLRYRVDDLGFVIDRPSHVWTVDLAGGDPVRVTDGDADHTGVDWSPDGELLTFAAARHKTAGDDLRCDVWVCRPDGSGLRALTAGGLAAAQPRFAPDGRRVYFVASQLSENDRAGTCRTVGLWVVPVDGSAAATRLTNRERYHLARPNGMIEALPDGVLFTDECRGAVRLLRVPVDGGEPAVLVAGERQVIGATTR